ncbi:MAG: hypothetical protein CMJ81_04090 [Planctomycetaceae bacterium]|nr:hypothetical protein [Planctomycetaceae bacterium]MBP62745.1 hypothetical protein [Planctomycetaceae bacterium]
MPAMQALPAHDVERALQAIEMDGFVLLEDAISAAEAAELAGLVLSAPDRAPGIRGYEFVVSLLNHDSRFEKLVTHPSVLELARHLIGGRTDTASQHFTWPVEDQIRLGSVDGLLAHPGSEFGHWHLDSPMGQLNPARPVPDFPIGVNSFWILTPFTKETGATRAMPGSHKLRHLPPATNDSLAGEVVCCGTPGSVVVMPNTVWHAAGSNVSKKPRIAVAAFYQPWWVGRLTMDMYPVRRDVWKTLSSGAQALTKHQLGWNTDFHGALTTSDEK